MIILDVSKIMLLGLLFTITHELGHMIAMKIKGHDINEINVGFFSIDIIDKNRNIIQYNDDFLIIISGCLMNIIIYIVFLALYYLTSIQIFMKISYINLSIGALNLLPISSLDGGQILYLYLSKFFSYKVTTFLCGFISIIFLLPLATIAFFTLLKSKYNFSLLFICCYLVYMLISKNDYLYS